MPNPNAVPEDSSHEPFQDEEGNAQPGTPEASVEAEVPGFPQPDQPSADAEAERAKEQQADES